MSPHANTLIHEDGFDSPIICSIFTHYDGYPDGLGKTLQNILKGYEIVCCYQCDTYKKANGMNCLTAQIITLLKVSCMLGNHYIYAYEKGDENKGYVYHIFLENNRLKLVCFYDGKRRMEFGV